jgi:TatD DNase family protein
VIDFHCHLDLYPDPNAVARSCIERRLYALSVTTTPSAWRGTNELTADASRIRTALGLHPQLAHERYGEMALFERLIVETSYVGEIGLDGGPEYKQHWDLQAKVLRRALDICSAAGGRVLSLHSRRAVSPVLDILESYPDAGTPILHWFAGTHRELARAVALGCWFSVGPGMLRGQKGRGLVSRMPKDRILTESDGPFAQIDGRPIWPWEAATAESELSRIWQQQSIETERQLRLNLTQLGRHARIAPESAQRCPD